MMILLASVLFGGVVIVLVNEFIVVMRVWGLEKILRTRIDSTRQVHQRGLTGNALFIAEKLGNYFKSKRIAFVHESAGKLSAQLSILGGQYKKMDPYTFIGIQLLSAFGSMVLAALLFSSLHVLLLAASGIFGFYLPGYFLQFQIKELQKGIFRQIPDVLDLLSIMIEAGLDFSAAMHKLIATEQGPLIRELAGVEQEIQLGKPRGEAFDAMAERLKYPPLTTLVSAITLAFRTGASLAPTLKTLSEQFRVERFQLAEKMAGEAPLKMMLPLALLIFPTIFIILFGPILLSFMGSGLY